MRPPILHDSPTRPSPGNGRRQVEGNAHAPPAALTGLARLLGRLAAREWLAPDGAAAGGESGPAPEGARALAPDAKRTKP